jgi:hypothetical protein
VNIYAGRPRGVPSATSLTPGGAVREGAPFSPDCVPAQAVDRCAEAIQDGLDFWDMHGGAVTGSRAPAPDLARTMF